jgi:K+-transporting ATPase A subunit
MNSTNVSGIVFVASLTVALIATYRPFGDYMARVFTSEKHTRAERFVYRIGGIDADADQTWGAYLRSVLAFAVVGVLFLYAFLRIQHLGVFGPQPRRRDQSPSDVAEPVVQHRRQLRHQHELAVLQR